MTDEENISTVNRYAALHQNKLGPMIRYSSTRENVDIHRYVRAYVHVCFNQPFLLLI